MKFAVFIVCLLLVFSGCSSTNNVEKNASEKNSYDVSKVESIKANNEEVQSKSVLSTNDDEIRPPEPAEYAYDINNDGKLERILNFVYEGDTHEEVYIILQDEGLIGYVDWTDLPMPGLFYWGVNAVSTHFDEKEKTIFINYYNQVEEEHIKLRADLELVRYVKYECAAFPFIDIDKAFAKYGEKELLK